MSRAYFEEVQSLRQNRWIWIVIITTILMTLLPLFDGIYWQIIKGEPWGEKPISNNGLIALFIFMIAISAFVTWILLSTKLETRINEEGLHYKFFPAKPKWVLVSKEEISSFEMRRQFNFFKSGR